MGIIANLQALNRKARSEKILCNFLIPINKNLPTIESESEINKKTKEEVAFRVAALFVVALKGEGIEQSEIEEIIKDYDVVKEYLSPEEKAFIQNPSPADEDSNNFKWRYESAWTLLWALGYVDKLNKPVEVCNVPLAVNLLKDKGIDKFVSDAKLRSYSEILDEADLIYRYDWAIVDARLKNKPAPSELAPGIVYERHYALNWLIGYMDEEWDDITTDT
jgi:hypothetical protein